MNLLTELQDLMSKQEPLSAELEYYLEENEDLGWPMLRHPLVFSVPHFDAMNALVNQRLREKKLAVNKARNTRRWDRFIFLHERPYRLDAFMSVEDILPDKKYWSLLGDIWTDSENIRQNMSEWRHLLSSHRPCRYAMMQQEERNVIKHDLPGEVTVYRGFPGRGIQHGFSWSTNPVVAKFFARRLAGKDEARNLVVGTVAKKDVIAYFDGRSEQEVVVLPENVTVTKLIELPDDQ